MTSPPRSPPSNLTVVTVEGCPSFVILDWEKSDNDTTGTPGSAPAPAPVDPVLTLPSPPPLEYEVISTAKGPDGEQVSVLTTNQTHTAVENLRPESRWVRRGVPDRRYSKSETGPPGYAAKPGNPKTPFPRPRASP